MAFAEQRSFAHRCLAPVVLVLLGLLALWPGSAVAQSNFPTREVSQRADAVISYWTEERMAGARPAEELLAGVALPRRPVGGERGEPRTVPPARPAPRGLIDDLLGAGTASPQAKAISNPRRRPFRTHGKVFITLGGIDYVCSATIVNSLNKRLVMTAGHCVYSRADGYASNWMFVPAYGGGESPYGRWVAERLATTPGWRKSEDLRYDVGTALVGKRNGRRIQMAVGARGIAFNRNPGRYRAYGYPASSPYDGRTLYVCDSPAMGTDSSVPSPSPRRIECDMTGGASGGGWVIRERAVASVTSYGYECGLGPLPVPILPCENPEQGKLFGPYFGETIQQLYEAQQRRLRQRP